MTKEEKFEECKNAIVTVLTEEENVPHKKNDLVEFFDDTYPNAMVARAMDTLVEEEVLMCEQGESDGPGRPPYVYFLSPEHYDGDEEEEDEDTLEVADEDIEEETVLADATESSPSDTFRELATLYNTMSNLGIDSATIDGDELRIRVKN